MKETLASALSGGPFAVARARWAARFAWCAAPDASPVAPVGAALGVSAADSGVALWSIQVQDERAGDWLDFVNTGADAASDAWRVARRHCPALVAPRWVLQHPPRLRALRIASEGEPVPPGLAGRSFGLAMCLARLSMLLDLPASPEVVATGNLRIDGTVGDVGRVKAKVDFVARWAPSVRKILVAPEDVESASEAASEHGLAVEGVATIDDAIPHAFPAAALAARLAELETGGEGPRLVRDLFNLAIGGTGGRPRWGGVARAAGHMEVNPRLTPAQVAQVRLARRIAQRHEGGSLDAAIRPEDVPAGLPLESRLELMAHVLQSQADAATEDWRASVTTADGMLRRPEERGDAEVMLLGAKARLLAAWREDADALALLRGCVRHWLQRRPMAASFPLCEHLRLTGITGDVDGVNEAIEGWVPLVWPELDDIGATFVGLAVGRALAQIGAPDRARSWLADGAKLAASTWADAMPHVERSRRRWLARVSDAGGEPERARRVRATLTEATCPGNLAFALHLARIDAALADGGDPDAAVLALQTEWPSAHDTARILRCAPARGLEGRARARHLADTWRY